MNTPYTLLKVKMNLNIVVFFVLLKICNSANILYISLTPSRSHYLWDKTIALALKERHNITFVSHIFEENTTNFTNIQFKGVTKKLHELGVFNLSNIKSAKSVKDIKDIFEIFTLFCKLNAKSSGLQKLIKLSKEKQKFDLIMMDLLCNQCLYSIVEIFNSPPFIGTSALGLTPIFWYSMGMDLQLSYVPFYKLTYTDKMSFLERMHNYFYTMLFLFWRQYIYMPKQNEIAKRAFSKDITPLEDIEKRLSLILANYDPIIDYPQSLPPSIIPVGGLHTQRKDVLPKSLESLLNEAKYGVILFSLGTNVLPSSLAETQKSGILKTFSKINCTIMWKYEGKLNNLPPNVIIRKWLPQNAILSHPNTKALITHAGALSIQEAVYHGIPIVVVPIFADQFYNAHKVITRKYGLRIYMEEIITDKFLTTINEVLTNPIYKNNIRTASEKYRDYSKNPLDKAVSSVEHVLKYGTGEHLHIRSKEMSYYQIIYLDIWIFISSIFVLVFITSRIVVHRIFRLF